MKKDSSHYTFKVIEDEGIDVIVPPSHQYWKILKNEEVLAMSEFKVDQIVRDSRTGKIGKITSIRPMEGNGSEYKIESLNPDVPFELYIQGSDRLRKSFKE